MKEHEEELTTLDQPPTAQQVFANMTELVKDGNTANQRNSESEPTSVKEDADMAHAIQSNPLPHHLPPQQDVFPFGIARNPQGLRDDPSKYGEFLVTQITQVRAKEVTKLDDMREELLKEAKYIADARKKTLKLQ
jgi:hypothetical protein